MKKLETDYFIDRLFVTFEGLDGSGKTYQSNKLKEYLSDKGYSVLLCSEMKSTELGRCLKDILLNETKVKNIDQFAEIFLFLAARSQMFRDLIGPALRKGDIVIADRWTDSTIAYQGYGNDYGKGAFKGTIDLIKSLNDIVTLEVRPDITFYLEVDLEEHPEISKPDRIESRGKEYFAEVQFGYRQTCDENKRYCFIPRLSKGTQTDFVIGKIDTYLRGHRRP